MPTKNTFWRIRKRQQAVDVNQIIEGKIVEINDEFVIVDVGFKSEGRDS